MILSIRAIWIVCWMEEHFSHLLVTYLKLQSGWGRRGPAQPRRPKIPGPCDGYCVVCLARLCAVLQDTQPPAALRCSDACAARRTRSRLSSCFALPRRVGSLRWRGFLCCGGADAYCFAVALSPCWFFLQFFFLRKENLIRMQY